MANRFYIPNNRPNAVASGINTGLGVVNTLASIKNQQDQTTLAKGRLDLDRQKMGLEQRRADVELGVPGEKGITGEGTMRADARLRELQIKAVQQQQDREDEKFRMSVQKANTQPKPGDIDGLEAMIPSISKQLFAPSIEKTSKPLFANVRKLAEQGLTRREIKDAMASTFTGSYNQMQMIEGAKKDFQAAFEQYGPDSPQAQSAKETLDAISDGSIVSVFFPSVAALEAAEKREMEAQIELKKASGAERSPYFTPVQTAQGVMSFNARTGTLEPVDVGGAPVIGSKSDPELQGRLSEATESGKGVGSFNMAQYDTATAAVANIQKIDDLVTHLETSEAITGMGAELFNNIERTKALLGSKVAAGKASDTEVLDAMMGAEVFPLIKALGVGARGLDTPAEREFMRKVLTGSINLNKETLLKMAQLRRDISERAIKKWNRRTEAGELDRFYKATGLPKQKIEIPSRFGGPQKGVVEDGYIFKGGDPADPKSWEKQ